MASNRSLIAFAFVKDEFDKTGDIVRGLMPLFGPIFAGMAGQTFSPAKFCAAVKQTYGLQMNVLVAEDWSGRFAEAGFLEATGDKYSQSFRCVAPAAAPVSSSAERVGAILTNLVSHVQMRLIGHGLEVAPEKLEAGIIERLQRPDYLSLLLKPEASKQIGQTLTLPSAYKIDPADKEPLIDYILATKLLDMADKEPNLFSLVADVAAGALVSEVILSLREPPSIGQRARGSIAFLDSPFVIDILDLADRKQSEYARELLEDLKKVGFALRIYEHNVREIRQILSAALNNYTDVSASTGSVAYRMRTDSSAPSRAQGIRPNLSERIKSYGITIVSMEDTTRQYASRFPDDAITDLISQIRPFAEIYSREIDAASIAGVARQVLGRNAVGSSLSLPALFITKNAGLARVANKLLIGQYNYNSDAAVPFLTDRQVAGLMWLALGGDAGGISTRQLLANCSLVITPRKDVLSSVLRFLEQTSEQAAKEFSALMTEGRCAHYVMDYTLGDAALVTAENAQDILEVVKRRAVEDVRLEEKANYDAKVKDIISNFDKEKEDEKIHHISELDNLTSENEKRINTLEEILREEKAIRTDAEQRAKEAAERLAKVSLEAELASQNIAAIEKSALLSCARMAREEAVKLRVFIVLGLSVVVAICGLMTNIGFAIIHDWKLLTLIGIGYAILSGCIAAALGWIVPDLMFGGLFRKYELNKFYKEFERRDLGYCRYRWNIEFLMGENRLSITPRLPDQLGT